MRSLAERLETEPDRDALGEVIGTAPNPGAWVAEMSASLEGMHGPALSPAQLGDVLREYVGNGHHREANMRHFRSYLRRGARPLPDTSASGAGGPSAPAGARAGGGGPPTPAKLRAGRVLAQIRALAEVSESPGHGRQRYIRRAAVEALGPDVLAAYDAIGGAAAVLETDGKGWGFLTRDFAAALEAGPPPELAAHG